MRNGFCSSGLGRLAVLLAAVFLFFGLTACGDPEGQCDDGQTFAQDRDGSTSCLEECETTADCAGDRVCDTRNLCILPPSTGNGDGDGENGDGENGDGENGDGDTTGPSCNLVEACTDLCTAQNTRCIGERCDGVTFQGEAVSNDEIQAIELDFCVEGFTSGNLSVAGCLDRGQAQCEGIEEEAAAVAALPCDSDFLSNFTCTYLGLYLLTIGEEVYDSCGCETPKIAEACETDADCGELGRNFCFEGACTQLCNGWDGAFENSGIPDPTCGENGMCSDFAFVNELGGWTGVCFKNCLGSDDCPQEGQACRLFGTLTSGEAIGACLDPQCTDEDLEACQEGQGCSDGNCVNSCEDDEDCDAGSCVEGFCAFDWTYF